MSKILYIEDTENNRILVTRRLEKKGYKVITAENAEEGLAIANAQKPALILMDMGMPDTPRKEGVILIVDDQENIRELLSRRLCPLGYSVQMAENGQRALESVAAKPPDLILLDIWMPDRDGFEVLRSLKADPATQHIP